VKQKILWCWLSFLLVAVLVLVCCGPKEEVVVKKGELYGGTFTIFNSATEFQMLEPPNPDLKFSNYTSLWWLHFMQETPVVGDLETYGPRGTGEYAFETYWFQPAEYMTGCLVESWEVSPEELVFHVRPGIYWAPTEHQSAWMEARELTAEDVALDITRFWESAWGPRFKGIIKDVYATDRYRVVVEFENFSPSLIYFIGYEDRALISPPETEIAGADKYENQVGTGPFMFEEYVVGSHMSYVRNPDYWGTTTINGKTYQLPFLDRVVVPIIPDESTQMAALQTGKIDLSRGTELAYWDTLDRLAPELEKTLYTPGRGRMVTLRNDQPPFDDVKVRRAMAIGTDQVEFAVLFKAGDLPIDFFPFRSGTPPYTPLKELPKDMQLLYSYDVKLAKQMLAEAGYPEGFTTKIVIEPSPVDLDIASLLKDQWAKIGVELNLDVVDEVEYVAQTYPLPVPKYSGTVLTVYSTADPLLSFNQYYSSGGSGNTDVYSNPEFDDLMARANLEMDVAEQTRLLKEAGIILREDWPRLPLYLNSHRTYWWPWVKNYYGEITIADDASFCPVIKYMWIDQALKAEMGY